MSTCRSISSQVLLGMVTIGLCGSAYGQVGGVDVQANQDVGSLLQNEVAVALNPTMPGNVVFVYNDFPYATGPGIGVSFSVNNGTTWQDRQLFVPGMVDHFDPMAAADTLGNLYAGCISTDGMYPGNSGIYVWTSADGGANWLGPMQVDFDPPGAQTLNDRGHMIVDTGPNSPYFNHVHVTWIKDVGPNMPFSDIYFSTMPPGGAFPPNPQFINDFSGSTMGHAPHIAVACDGTLYCVWTSYNVVDPNNQKPFQIFFDVSYDGGVTWQPDTPIHPGRTYITVPRIFTDPYGTGTRADTAPCIAVHPTNPQEVYLVYPEDPDGIGVGDEGTIMFMMSPDGGMSWSSPYELMPDPGADFAPWIDVKPSGIIDIAWYHGGLGDNQPLQWLVGMMQSRDGGVTWIGPGTMSDMASPAPFDPWFTVRWLGEYLGLVTDKFWASAGTGWSHVGFASAINDQHGDVFHDAVENQTFDDCNFNGQPDAADIAYGSSNDANGNGIPDECEPFFREFSLDIGSDSELSDPFRDGDEGVDPGDVYHWIHPPFAAPGRNGFKDDLTLFGPIDPPPTPPDAGGFTAVPIGNGNIVQYRDYFDLDAHDQLDFSLEGAEFPLLENGSPCVFTPMFLLISYDDDTGWGWPQADVPINVQSPTGNTYGQTVGQDEVLGVELAPPMPPPVPVLRTYPLADEFNVHRSLSPNPDAAEMGDDDVDSLDIVFEPDLCSYWYFSSDHEAHFGFAPSAIYLVLPFGSVPVIDAGVHLGISPECDIDAFEFAWMPMPANPGPLYLALIFSVDDDDPLTGVDESGGLNPTKLYISWMTGFSTALTDPLEDDIDALTIWADTLEPGACCFGPALPLCVVTDAHTCVQVYQGAWQGPGTDCSDADHNGIADMCEPPGACCIGVAGQCVLNRLAACDQLDGVWMGPGTDCTDYNGDAFPDACEAHARCAGDANCDRAVNWRDIDFFVAAQGDNIVGWQMMFGDPSHPGCPFANNDCNFDGIVNWRDIDSFVALQGTICP